MVASLNAFMKINGARGESKQGQYKDWIELQAWEWEVEAETNWTKGGGASVGKPSPGKLMWEHYFDRSSPTLLGYICTGSAFPDVSMEMCKATGITTGLQAFLIVQMKEVFITKVNQAATEEGNVVQKVEMVFKDIFMSYKMQGGDPLNPGILVQQSDFSWDIPGGSASPGAP